MSDAGGFVDVLHGIAARMDDDMSERDVENLTPLFVGLLPKA